MAADKRGKGKRKYYIGGRQYIPEESILLCAFDCSKDLASIAYRTEKLYCSRKGAFFLVREGTEAETKVEILDKEKASEFMDRHTAGIVTENYDMILGTPELG